MLKQHGNNAFSYLYSNYTQNEVSGILNVPLGSVKTRLWAVLCRYGILCDKTKEKRIIKLDIQAYISSGAIESYVLGLASPDEKRELETLAAQHAEIKEALLKLEESIKISTIKNAEPDPVFLQTKKKALENEGMQKKSIPLNTTTQPTSTTTQTPTAKTIPLTYAPKGIMWLRGAIAACIIMLIGSSIINFYFYSKYREFNNKYESLLAENNLLATKIKALEAGYKLVKNPGMKLVTLSAVPNQQGSLATIYWDTQSKDVWLIVNSLPQTPLDKQYQLWAIVDGKPIDAGMVDMAKANELVKMKKITNAEAFAITLEIKGGSNSPTMEQMYVLGKLKE